MSVTNLNEVCTKRDIDDKKYIRNLTHRVAHLDFNRTFLTADPTVHSELLHYIVIELFSDLAVS